MKVPGPGSLEVIRLLIAKRGNPIAMLGHLAQNYGDVIHFQLGRRKIYLLNHPDYIRDVLVSNYKLFHKGLGLEQSKKILGEGLLTSEGEIHRRQRRMLQPAFHRKRILAYVDLMVDFAARTSASWQGLREVDLNTEMMRLTLEIATKALFGADLEKTASSIEHEVDLYLNSFSRNITPYERLLAKLPLERNRRIERAKLNIEQTIYQMIESRRGEPARGDDLLGMMLNMQDHEGDGSRLSSEEIRDQVMTMFIAGHETTSNALTWAFYVLSQHPEIEQRVLDELADVLNGRLPRAEDLNRLEYTAAVLDETMRMYPPVWLITRRNLDDYHIAGYTIPKGSLIFLSQYISHWDKRFFPNPEQFIPERFLGENLSSRPKLAYFPFGAGPRTCIGDGFARMEGTLLLASILQDWRLRLVPGHRVEINPQITLRPKYGMRMLLSRRTPAKTLPTVAVL